MTVEEFAQGPAQSGILNDRYAETKSIRLHFDKYFQPFQRKCVTVPPLLCQSQTLGGLFRLAEVVRA